MSSQRVSLEVYFSICSRITSYNPLPRIKKAWKAYKANQITLLVSRPMIHFSSLVPRLPDLFNACEKRGGAWYAKSREQRHKLWAWAAKTARLQMCIKSQVPIEKDVNKGLATVSYLAIYFSRPKQNIFLTISLRRTTWWFRTVEPTAPLQQRQALLKWLSIDRYAFFAHRLLHHVFLCFLEL